MTAISEFSIDPFLSYCHICDHKNFHRALFKNLLHRFVRIDPRNISKVSLFNNNGVFWRKMHLSRNFTNFGQNFCLFLKISWVFWRFVKRYTSLNTKPNVYYHCVKPDKFIDIISIVMIILRKSLLQKFLKLLPLQSE